MIADNDVYGIFMICVTGYYSLKLYLIYKQGTKIS